MGLKRWGFHLKCSPTEMKDQRLELDMGIECTTQVIFKLSRLDMVIKADKINSWLTLTLNVKAPKKFRS